MIEVGKLHAEKRNKVTDKSISHTKRILPSEYKLEESNTIREVIENLDRDVVDLHSNLTTIDFNTRLRADEVGSIVALQMLHTLNVGGAEVSLLARSVKRHKVSLKGLGREEKVRIIQGEREHEQSKDTSLFGKIKGFMGKKDDN